MVSHGTPDANTPGSSTARAAAIIISQQYAREASDYSQYPSFDQAYAELGHEIHSRDAIECLSPCSVASTADSIGRDPRKTRSEPGISCDHTHGKTRVKRSGRKVTKRSTLEAAFYQEQIDDLLLCNEDDALPDIPAYQGASTLDATHFVLRASTPIRAYIALIDDTMKFMHTEEEILETIRAAFLAGGNTAGSRWYRFLPRFERERITSKLTRLVKYLTDDCLLVGFPRWLANAGWADEDFQDGDCMIPDELANSEVPWCHQTTELEDEVDANVILSHMGMDLSITDRGLTAIEKSTWFKSASENQRFPTRALGLPNYYGTLPNHVPRAKTITNPHGSWTIARLNDSKDNLPKPIDDIMEVDFTLRTVTNEFGNAIHSGKSYPYNPIIFVDGELATLYSDETLDQLGCDNLATLATVFRIESLPHRVTTMTIDYIFTCRDSRVPLITARIPMTAVISDFDIKQLTAHEVRHHFKYMGLTHGQRHEALRVQCKLDTGGIELFHDRQAQRDMTRAGFPDLIHLLSHITNQYEASIIDMDIFVSIMWSDFPFWATTLPDMLNLAHSDDLASIRALLTTSNVVEPRTLNMSLPNNTVQLPPLSRFESIDDQISILSDGFVRDAQYQALTAEMFGDQLVRVVMIPLEGMHVNVPCPKDESGQKTEQKKYLYHLIVTQTKDMKRLIEVCPPPGTMVSCQIDVPSAPVRQTTHALTEDERSAILARQIFRSLADAEGEDIGSYIPPEKGTQEFEDVKGISLQNRRQAFRERARFHLAMAAIDPFVIPPIPKDGQTVDQAQTLRDEDIMRFAKVMMRRWWPRNDGTREKELDSTWRHRLLQACTKFKEMLVLPVLPMTEAPLWLGQIMDYDGPLTAVGPIHIVVRLPKAPNWDRTNGPAPFIHITDPPLPDSIANGEKFAADLVKVLDIVTRRATLQMQVDEKTLQERLKGCKKHEQMRGVAANNWLATLRGTPVLGDLFGMIPLLGDIRYHVVQSQISADFGNGEYELDSIILDDDLTYPEPEVDANGAENPITTRRFQVNRNQALKAYTRMVMNFDRDQLQAFYDMAKCPYGMYFLQGCPGSGKSKVISVLACVIWDSELCTDDQMSKHVTTAPAVKAVKVPRDVKLVYPVYDDDIVWCHPTLRIEEPIDLPETPEPTEGPEHEQTNLELPEPITFPPLRGGPSKSKINKILQSLDHNLSMDEFLTEFLDEVWVRFERSWCKRMENWLHCTLLPLFEKELRHLSRQDRASFFPSILEENETRYRAYGTKYFDQWAASVRSAFKHESDDGYTNADYYTKALQEIPIPQAPVAQPLAPERDVIDDLRAQLLIDTGDAPPNPQAPVPLVNGRIAVVVNRNVHAERVAEGLLDVYAEAHPDGRRTIVKVNNLVLETKQLLRDMRGIDRTAFIEDSTFSVSLQMHADLGLTDAADFTFGRRAHERKLTGGTYTLGAMVKSLLASGKAPGLQALLDLEADPNTPDDQGRTKEIEKSLLRLYKAILDKAHAVIATPVVLSKLADRALYNPCLIIFDEAGMTPECDTLLVLNQFPSCRWFAMVGDWRQEGIITLSDTIRTQSDPMFALYNPPEQKEGKYKGEKKLAVADYRLEAELETVAAPFVRQFRESLLARVDKATPYVAHTNINHRSVGGLERIASVVAYDGRMESAYHPQDLSAAGRELQDFLRNEILVLGKNNSQGTMRGSRATIYMDGTPTRAGTSWTNHSQLQLAVYCASRAHMAGLRGDNGDLLTILLITPYAQAARDAKRFLASVSDWEICKSNIIVNTIDGAQGDEADLVITPYIAGDRGGFLWQKARPVVAWTRPRLGAIDILNESFCQKTNPNWNHWRTYRAIQSENNAATFTARDWSQLSGITYTPASDKTSPRSSDLFCPNCDKYGHHPRNCAAPRRGGLNKDGSNVPPEYKKSRNELKAKVKVKDQTPLKVYTEAQAKGAAIIDTAKKFATTYPTLDPTTVPEDPDLASIYIAATQSESDSSDEDLEDHSDTDNDDQPKPRRRTRLRGTQVNYRKTVYIAVAANDGWGDQEGEQNEKDSEKEDGDNKDSGNVNGDIEDCGDDGSSVGQVKSDPPTDDEGQGKKDAIKKDSTWGDEVSGDTWGDKGEANQSTTWGNTATDEVTGGAWGYNGEANQSTTWGNTATDEVTGGAWGDNGEAYKDTVWGSTTTINEDQPSKNTPWGTATTNDVDNSFWG